VSFLRAWISGNGEKPAAESQAERGIAQLIDLSKQQSLGDPADRPPETSEPSPEPASASAPDDGTDHPLPAAEPRTGAVWAGSVLVAMALGILGQAWVGYQGRITGSPSPILWYATLCLIFVPSAALIMSGRLSDQARVWFTLFLSLALLATRFVLYPDQFVYHDELINYRVLLSIEQTKHLFTPNSLLPVTADYPGLAIATSAVHQLTGLSLHSSGMTILFAARLITTLSLVRVTQRISGSVILGCMAALIYATNPQYTYFNSQYSYQSIALPLCFFCVYVFTMGKKKQGPLAVVPSAAVILAVAASHHLSSLALIVVLWVWYLFTRITKRPVDQLLALAVISLLIVAVWTFMARSVIVPYISEIARNSIANIVNLVQGKSSHQFFTDPAGDHNPAWEVALSAISVLLIMLTLVPALWHAFMNRRLLTAAAITLFVIAAMYPIIPLGHLTNATAEVSDRSSGFIYVGLAYLVAAWWFRSGVFHRHARENRFTVPRHTWLLVVGLTICFVGGTIIGSGPSWLFGPGRYLVSADNRSVDPLALQAARWEGENLPPHSRVFTDRVNGLLAAVYGDQHVLTALGDRIDEGTVSTLLLRNPARADVSVACRAGVQFLIADQRLATSLPHVGVYIDVGEYLSGMRTAPPDPGALTKFDNISGAQRIFDNGAIRIYDLRELQCAGRS
jgi:hypothetical protein